MEVTKHFVLLVKFTLFCNCQQKMNNKAHKFHDTLNVTF